MVNGKTRVGDWVKTMGDFTIQIQNDDVENEVFILEIVEEGCFILYIVI